MLRKICIILGMVVMLEVAAILFTPSYERELTEAKRAYEKALMENVMLQRQFSAKTSK